MSDYATLTAKMRAATSLQEFHQYVVALVQLLKQTSGKP